MQFLESLVVCLLIVGILVFIVAKCLKSIHAWRDAKNRDRYREVKSDDRSEATELIQAKGEPGGSFAERALALSEEMGNEIDYEYSVLMSRSEGYPFYAETEREYESFKSLSESPFSRYPNAIYSAIRDYSHGVGDRNKNPMKVEYLVNLLKGRAQKGDRCSQALLMKMQVAVCGDYDWAVDEAEKAKQMYAEDFEKAVLLGEADALYAKAMVFTRYDSMERFNLLLEAGQKGLSDAYYEIALNTLNNLVHTETGSFPEFGELIYYYRLAAEADNGVFAPAAQYTLAEAYADGEGDLTSSKSKVLYWYRKAAEGGDKMAQSSLSLYEEGRLSFDSIAEGKSKNIEQLTPDKVRALCGQN